MPEEHGERTEQATPRRRQKAKEQGQVARSRELISMSAMAGTILVFYFAGNLMMKNISTLTGRLLSLHYGREPMTVMRYASTDALWILLPFLGVAAIFSLFAGIAQGGFFLKPLNVEIERVNPVSGFKRLFSRQGLVELLKSLLKFIVGGVIFYIVIKKTIVHLPFTTAMDFREMQNTAIGLIFKALLYSFGIFFVLAVIDYIYERWKFERSIRMTREEIKQETKETEGDPLIRSRIKSIQREMARKRMMQEVPKATVVITNPTHIAVALKYKDRDMSAPMVVAKGAGFMAEKIKEKAREHGIPVVEDKPLARQLYKVKIGSYIPVELYKAVAKILAYIYRLKGVA